MKKIDWNIIAKYTFNEKVNTTEKKWIEDNAEEEHIKSALKESAAIKEKAAHYFSLGQYNTSKGWEKVNSKINTRNKIHKITSRLWKAAAIMLVILSSTFMARYYHLLPTQLEQFNTSTTDLHRPTLQLPDGSTVVMNYDTELKYPKSFKQKNREVWLSGEAFFDIKPHSKKPFIIHTANARVQVLGTSFNIKAYNKTQHTEVLVESGSVEVQNIPDKRQKAKKIRLSAGQMGIVNAQNGTVSLSEKIEPNTMAWLTRHIEFNAIKLSEALLTIESVYGISFDVNPNVDLTQNITASFSHHNHDYIIEVIAMTLNLEIHKTLPGQYIVNTKSRRE